MEPLAAKCLSVCTNHDCCNVQGSALGIDAKSDAYTA